MTQNVADARRRGWLRLSVVCGAICLVWLVMLPWVAAQPAVEARSQRLEEQGIDPAAMFYTELPMMERVLQKLEREQPAEPSRG